VYIRGTEVFKKNLGAHQNSFRPEGWVEASSTLRIEDTSRHRTKFIRPDELATRIGVTIFVSMSGLMPSNGRMISD